MTTERQCLTNLNEIADAKIEKWRTHVIYVDIDTGEILDEEWAKGLYTRQPIWREAQTYRYGDYTIINRKIDYEKITGTTEGIKWLRYECKRNAGE